jgi:uncharacterized protein (TIGR03437 family)
VRYDLVVRFIVRSVNFCGFAALLACWAPAQIQTSREPVATQVHPLALNQTRYRLRAGESIKIDAPAETVDFLAHAKARRVAIGGTEVRGIVVAPSMAGDQILLGASLTMKAGEYVVTLSAVDASGQERRSNANIAVAALPAVPGGGTTPPVVLLNGWQFSCPIAPTGSVATFGSLASQLVAPQVYFFDNCVEQSVNGPSIEGLGLTLGQFLNMIQYAGGGLVPQVDLVSHSMGGLIVRAYLSGLQSNGSLAPVLNPRVRKFIEIATPNFGSFFAANYSYLVPNGTQTAEMLPGSSFLWSLATWNQRRDDLRGVDALAIIGNAGYWQDGTTVANLSDGVVSVTSASLNFARDPSRTRILPYCHIDSASLAGKFIDCTGGGIADVDEAPETGEIILSFLANTTAWQSIGNSNQTQYGGAYFALENAAGTQYTPFSSVTWGTVPFDPGPANTIFYNEFINGSETFSATSTTNQTTECGPFTASGGTFIAFLCKFNPVIYSVGPLLSNVAGMVVASGGSIAISGVGFGTQCSGCQVTAYPGPVALTVSSWSDTAIIAYLPATFSGIAEVIVQAAGGSDSMTFMASPPAPPTISLSSAQLQFFYTMGGAAPAAQSIQVTNSGGGALAFTALASTTSGGNWLSVSPNSGNAPATLMVSANPAGLGAGTYTGTVQIAAVGASNSPASFGVTLTLAAAQPVLAVSPQALTFNYTMGGTTPAAQTLSITNTGGGSLSWTASASATWVGLSAMSGTAPTTLSVSVNPANLAVGTYSANVQISAAGATGSPASIAVALTVQAATSTVGITAVTNGASFQPGFASATWVSIFGTNLAQTTRTWQAGDFVGDLLPTSLSGVSVTVNGIPAYVEYISPTQINVLAPDDSTLGAVQVQVTTAQGTSNSFTAQKQQFLPAFFIIGSRYVAALHADYTLVGKTGFIPGATSSPAKPGETILLYATGFGPTNPPLPSADLVTTPEMLANSAQVTIGGQVAPIAWAGLVEAGLYQLNVTVPNLPNGDAVVLATIGDAQSQSGVLVTVGQ